jgi:acetyltransferase-like isoleucine patch superfamily enzyme
MSTDQKALLGHPPETPAARFKRLVAGPSRPWAYVIWQEMLLTLLYGIPSAPGLLLRAAAYRHLFNGYGPATYLGHHVNLKCPRSIYLGSNVLVDDYAQFWGVELADRTPSIRLSDGTFVRSYAMLNAGPPTGHIHVGNQSSIGQATLIYGHGGVIIGDNVMIAGHCSIIASSHVAQDSSKPMRSQGFTAKGISIGDDVWLGTGSRILDGVSIGAGSIIGANAVVNRPIPSGVIAAGVPAKVIRERKPADSVNAVI